VAAENTSHAADLLVQQLAVGPHDAVDPREPMAIDQEAQETHHRRRELHPLRQDVDQRVAVRLRIARVLDHRPGLGRAAQRRGDRLQLLAHALVLALLLGERKQRSGVAAGNAGVDHR